VALAGDRDFTEKGLVLDFFGKPAFFPEGPAAFALKTGAVIVPAFMVRNKDDSFTLKVEKPLEFNPTDDKDKDLIESIKRYKSIFEDYIRRYPEQWYMFRKFWIQ
jgi:KDO2-lipid IV(A) lauroyltransferase